MLMVNRVATLSRCNCIYCIRPWAEPVQRPCVSSARPP